VTLKVTFWRGPFAYLRTESAVKDGNIVAIFTLMGDGSVDAFRY